MERVENGFVSKVEAGDVVSVDRSIGSIRVPATAGARAQSRICSARPRPTTNFSSESETRGFSRHVGRGRHTGFRSRRQRSVEMCGFIGHAGGGPSGGAKTRSTWRGRRGKGERSWLMAGAELFVREQNHSCPCFHASKPFGKTSRELVGAVNTSSLFGVERGHEKRFPGTCLDRIRPAPPPTHPGRQIQIHPKFAPSDFSRDLLDHGLGREAFYKSLDRFGRPEKKKPPGPAKARGRLRLHPGACGGSPPAIAPGRALIISGVSRLDEVRRNRRQNRPAEQARLRRLLSKARQFFPPTSSCTAWPNRCSNFIYLMVEPIRVEKSFC